MTKEELLTVSNELHDMCKRIDAFADHLHFLFKDEGGHLPDYIESAINGFDDAICLAYGAIEHIDRINNGIKE